jgi:GTP-binding protein
VLFKADPITGDKLEPIEELTVDVDEEYTGVVVEKVSTRKGEMVDMRPSGGGKTRIIFHVPARGLIGYQGQFLTDTRGTGMINRMFHDYAPYKGDIEGRRNGALISTETGEAVAYGIWNLQDRGIMFVDPGDKIYAGMIVGEHSRDNDLEINILRNKQLTNIRTTSKDEAIRLVPPMKMTLEQMISYIQEDELLEVTPKSLRLRKSELDTNERKKAGRASKKSA